MKTSYLTIKPEVDNSSRILDIPPPPYTHSSVHSVSLLPETTVPDPKNLSKRRPWIKPLCMRQGLRMHVAAKELRSSSYSYHKMHDLILKGNQYKKLKIFWSRALETVQNTKTESKQEYLVELAQYILAKDKGAIDHAADVQGNKDAVRLRLCLAQIADLKQNPQPSSLAFPNNNDSPPSYDSIVKIAQPKPEVSLPYYGADALDNDLPPAYCGHRQTPNSRKPKEGETYFNYPFTFNVGLEREPTKHIVDSIFKEINLHPDGNSAWNLVNFVKQYMHPTWSPAKIRTEFRSHPTGKMATFCARHLV